MFEIVTDITEFSPENWKNFSSEKLWNRLKYISICSTIFALFAVFCYEYNFERNSSRNNSLKNSLGCPKTKPSSHCSNVLFPIYQNNNWTIKRSSHRIMLKIVEFQDRLLNETCSGLQRYGIKMKKNSVHKS